MTDIRDIESRLAALSHDPAEAQRAAVLFVGEADLGAWPMSARLAALAALSAHPVDDLDDVSWMAQRRALGRVHAALPLDPAFLADEDKRLAELTRRIDKDWDLQAALQSWRGAADLPASRDTLAKVIEAQARVFGYPAPALRFFTEPKPDPIRDRGRNFQHGRYSPEEGVIELNTHEDGAFAEPRAMVEIVLHLGAYAQQRQLAAAFAAGHLPASDPRHAQARIFHEAFQPGGKLTESYAGRLGQPIERHATRLSQAAVESIFSPRLASTATAPEESALHSDKARAARKPAP